MKTRIHALLIVLAGLKAVDDCTTGQRAVVGACWCRLLHGWFIGERSIRRAGLDCICTLCLDTSLVLTVVAPDTSPNAAESLPSLSRTTIIAPVETCAVIVSAGPEACFNLRAGQVSPIGLVEIEAAIVIIANSNLAAAVFGDALIVLTLVGTNACSNAIHSA